MKDIFLAASAAFVAFAAGLAWSDVIGLEDVRVAPEKGDSGEPVTAGAAFELSAAEWVAEPSWLGNPAGRFGVSRAEGGTLFHVEEAGRGMKWRWSFGEPRGLAGHRYLAVRYRAKGLARHHDYALCFLGQSNGGSAYEEVVRGTDLQADGRRWTLAVPLKEAAARMPEASGMAIQVQAARSGAELCIESVRLVAERPRSVFGDLVPFEAGTAGEGFEPIELGAVCNQSLGPVLAALELEGWPDGREIRTKGIPFRLAEGAQALTATGLDSKTELTIPVGRRANQVFLLMLCVLRGQEEPVFGGGLCRRIGDVDRFRLRLTYEDGTEEACFPGDVFTGRFELTGGPQVVCAFADGEKTLRDVTVCDNTAQGGFAVAAVTCRTGGPVLFAQLDESGAPVSVERWNVRSAPGVGSTRAGPGHSAVTLENGLLKAQFEPESANVLGGLYDKVAGRYVLEPAKSHSLFTVTVDGRRLERDELRPAGAGPREGPDGGETVGMAFDVLPCPGVQLHIAADFTERGALRFRGELANTGAETHRIGLTAPQIGPYVLGDELGANEYVYPCRAAYVGGEEANLSTRYSGMFGVQFMATVNAGAGQGLYLRTEDTNCIERDYVLRKDGKGLFLAIGYPERPLAPGERRRLADTLVAVSDGDWHGALHDYRRWLRTWYRPASPRKAWFREAFNFRQRFLHWLDPLYDPETGKIDLERAVAEAEERFGGIDYLHLFDWGNCGPHGRIYGRVGDYSPYDYIKGGRDNLYGAIAGIRGRGVPVGLYIEGYLLNETGKLGQEFGDAWQLRRPDGEGARWPNSTEIFVCPAVASWRDVQARTYAEKVGELDVDGMYIDQFGFTGHDKDCYSDAHGHGVPSYPVVRELETTQAVRRAVDAVKHGVAIYTEESPCDVTSQFQDGSFTYEMNQCHGRGAAVPLNLFRFAVPDFKTFEILICDRPTGSWATGVKWTFFNGEGLWLEGPANEWFEPDTLAAIRRCHAILRRYRDAFTSLEPEPLWPTPAPGVFANCFPGEDKDVWTFYNARHRTYRGPVLRVAGKMGWEWYDAWREEAPAVTKDEEYDVVEVTLEPHGVGCLVRHSGGTS